MTLPQFVGQDLVVLVPDKNMEATVSGLLRRPDALGIRPVSFRVFVHPERDPGCLRHSHDFLRPWATTYSYALVLFDHAGCGREELSARELEAEVEGRLAESGWGDRQGTVCIYPELEMWVWANSPQVASALGWNQGWDTLREWLAHRDLWAMDHQKPSDPKAAMEAALHFVKKSRSSAVYTQLASTVSLQRCVVPSFARFRRTLCDWFPQPCLVSTTPTT